MKILFLNNILKTKRKYGKGPEEICSQLNLWRSLNGEFVSSKLNLTSFAYNLSYFYLCGSGSIFRIRIRIQKVAEYVVMI